MALYIPAGRRRRKLIVAAVAGVVLGLVLGIVIGRASAPSLSDEVSSAQTKARAIAGRLQALPIEYEKAQSGAAGAADIPAAIASIKSSVPAAVASAPWLSDADDQAIEADIEAVATAATAKKSTAEVEKAVDDAVETLNTAFGIR
ncbi:MAG: hypothetical protein AB7L13_09755 [Acidimicrobiia bacterium]